MRFETTLRRLAVGERDGGDRPREARRSAAPALLTIHL